MKKILLILLLAVSISPINAQIDVTKYVSGNLFEAKPVITKEIAEENLREEGDVSFFERDIEEGMNLWDNGDLDDAAHHFSIMTDEYPQVAQIYFFLGGIYYEQEQYDEAKFALKKSLQLDPLILESRYVLGLIALEENDMDTSKDIMKSLSEVPLYAAQGYFGLAMIATEEQNAARAKRMYEKCLKVDSTFKAAYLPLTLIDLYVYDNIRSSYKRMNQAVNLDSTWQEARIARGILSLIVTKELFQFEKDINTLIKLDPSNYHYYSIKAYLSVEQKKYRKAVINFRNAYNLEVDSLNKGNYKFSTKLERNKELQSALNYYHEKLGEIRPKTREFIDQGICQHILDNEQKAWRFYDSAYIEQDNSVTDFLKAVLYESDWNGSENAITFYTRALEKDSMIYSAYVNRAQIFAKNQNYQEAIVDCNKMIKLKPERKDGYKMKSTILMTTGRYIKAYQELTKAIFRDSSDMDLFFDRGMAALTTKYFKESRKDFEHVIKNNPQDGEAYYFLSINSLNMGDTLLAIKELDSASKFSRYKVNYHKELLALAKSQNLIDHQEIAYNRLVRYRSYNIDYRMNRAEFFYQQERYEEALKDFTFVVERRKKHRRATYYLGKTQIELGDIKSGEKLISKAKRLGFKE